MPSMSEIVADIVEGTTGVRMDTGGRTEAENRQVSTMVYRK